MLKQHILDQSEIPENAPWGCVLMPTNELVCCDVASEGCVFICCDPGDTGTVAVSQWAVPLAL